MDYIRFSYNNGSTTTTWDLPYPKKFEMKKVPNIVNEFETMAGNMYADINGWRYADVTIEWGGLYPEDLQKLVGSTGLVKYGPEFTITFINGNGQTETQQCILRSFTGGKTLIKDHGGKYIWDGVSVSLSFPTCHTY